LKIDKIIKFVTFFTTAFNNTINAVFHNYYLAAKYAITQSKCTKSLTWPISNDRNIQSE